VIGDKYIQILGVYSMTDVRNMRKLMEATEDLWAIEAMHESDIEAIIDEEVVDNSEEARRNRIVGNFESDLNDLIYEYYHGAETFGNAQKVLRDASFGVK
jgi:hypothetical protein